jgi:malto-oligosyltrehalose synthase/4-alpha-glucanotransferase
MFNPISTYRIQFNKDFTFQDFDRIIPYLYKLGISTIYASPILESSPGSMHGYDTTNPLKINPEIGTEAQFASISRKLKKYNMGWIQDIVPNHMAFHPGNLWLMDVLQYGTASEYFTYFDINWVGDVNQPIMVPFLGEDLDKVIENGELLLVLEEDKIFLNYSGDQKYPINEVARQQLKALDTDLKIAVQKANEDKKMIQSIANAQYYRLCNWQETNRKINFRRFFTVNGLICLNIQHEDVFNAYHKYIKELLDKGFIQGLRVDHIDGLYQPEAYLSRLRALAGDDVFIVIEKILESGEEMPVDWPIQGNTGYDFLSTVNNLLTNRSSKKDLTNFYDNFSTSDKPVHEQILEKKELILGDYMQGELDNLYQFYLAKKFNSSESVSAEVMKEVLSKLLILCPVYRFYGDKFPLSGEERSRLKKLLNQISTTKKLKKAVAILKGIWLTSTEDDLEVTQKARAFYLRCMQFSGPLMAKGVEDTLMYTYQRLIVHNEVGDAPENYGISKKKFNKWIQHQQKYWPLSQNATATHDTKRGEDARARLNVLSDLPEQWMQAVEHWNTINEHEIRKSALNMNDVYFIYQTLMGTYPMPSIAPEDYAERLTAYLEKALREGKQNSDWANPDKKYESALKDFAVSLVAKDHPFWTNFSELHKKVSDFGILNSLIQIVLKHTLPGIPDVYQGTELWDLSFVDPDNRRKVDYNYRLSKLKRFTEGVSLDQLWESRYSGEIKLWLQHQLLTDPIKKSAKPQETQFIALKVKGKFADRVLAFAMKAGQDYRIIAIPLNLATLTEGRFELISEIEWGNTKIVLPAGLSSEWRDNLSGHSGQQTEGNLFIKDLFFEFPLAIVRMRTVENNRGSGILMHVTSLPSSFGIGDFGPESVKFIDFLSASGQKYWQMLPLNPVSAQQAYSPYSSDSSIAGNILLISPELLQKDGLLSKKHLKTYALVSKNKIEFNDAISSKVKILDLAYTNFKELKSGVLRKQFIKFCEKEALWLDDFALYTDLKAFHDNKAWFDWDSGFKQKNDLILREYSTTRSENLDKIKWLQFIFFKQWSALKGYANANNIKLFGDLPFYISHDSVDVWANPELFKLNEEGQMTGIAGVPPDYFNSDGQLWGMPVFNWEAVKQRGYDWWIRRIEKNMELYDLLRLDHFRAFAAYWDVPALEKTAKNGSWEIGPGQEFFALLKVHFPELPFIAEDLGEITPDVYALRDEYQLPGMKVLQFAFGDDIASSPHIPHNYANSNFVAYTGTHDNNTTVGWYNNDLTADDHKRLTLYSGGGVSHKNVHLVASRLAMASIADLVILPLQDLLGLDQSSRMNTPASVENNWVWRLKRGQLKKEHQKRLLKWTKIFGRI